MTMLEIIEKKKLGKELTAEEIAFFVKAAAEKSVPDYQLAALLMAIRLQGMTERETVVLTLSMRDTGDVADLSSIPGISSRGLAQLYSSWWTVSCSRSGKRRIMDGSAVNSVSVPASICAHSTDRKSSLMISFRSSGSVIPSLLIKYSGSNLTIT